MSSSSSSRCGGGVIAVGGGAGVGADEEGRRMVLLLWGEMVPHFRGVGQQAQQPLCGDTRGALGGPLLVGSA